MLTREKYPFDQLHKKNEESAGNPKEEKAFLSDLNDNNLMSEEHGQSQLSKKNLSNPSLVSQEDQKNFPKNIPNLHNATIKKEIVMEFSPEFFKSSTSVEKLNTNKGISTESRGLSSEELE